MTHVCASTATYQSVERALDEAFEIAERNMVFLPRQAKGNVTADDWRRLARRGMTAREAASVFGKSYSAALSMESNYQDIVWRKERVRK